MLTKHSKYVYIVPRLLTDVDIESIFGDHPPDDPYDVSFNRKSYRKCDKRIFTDTKLSNLVWSRLERFTNQLTVVEGSKIWVPFCCADRIKLIRYKPGDSFSWHVDSSTMINKKYKVIFSVTIYLNTVPKKHGGMTMFKHGTDIHPVKGTAMLLNTLYGPEHCGQVLKNGVKYILRLDILGRADSP